MKNKLEILLIGVLFLLVLTPFVLSEDGERDSDLDGIPDMTDKYPFDYDNDGMPDIWEKKNKLRYDLDDADEDADADGIKNIDEYRGGTDPLLSDQTQTRVQQEELFSPVEKVVAKILLWVGIGLFILLGAGFFLYRTHIVTIAKFFHHASKAHFERERRKAMGIPGQVPQRQMPPRYVAQRPPVQLGYRAPPNVRPQIPPRPPIQQRPGVAQQMQQPRQARMPLPRPMNGSAQMPSQPGSASMPAQMPPIPRPAQIPPPPRQVNRPPQPPTPPQNYANVQRQVPPTQNYQSAPAANVRSEPEKKEGDVFSKLRRTI
ncbi:MAG: hypothetical protein U9O94_07420 [Nanoarchaeota archaeon]|nr:hypothetical protein [Nanoarchaeota archaeon]